MYKNIRNISNKVYWLIFICLIVISLLAMLSEFGIPKQNQILVVQSGSMEPAIKTGSIVIVQPNNNYSKGDIITFKKIIAVDANTRRLQLITHRIWDVKKVKEGITYITKGDANKSPDMESINKDYVIGKVAFSVPYIGYPVGFAKTQNGFILLIVIPATIIIYSELVNIKNEAMRLLKERKTKLSTKEKVEVAIVKEEVVAEKEIRQLLRKLEL